MGWVIYTIIKERLTGGVRGGGGGEGKKLTTPFPIKQTHPILARLKNKAKAQDKLGQYKIKIYSPHRVRAKTTCNRIICCIYNKEFKSYNNLFHCYFHFLF